MNAATTTDTTERRTARKGANSAAMSYGRGAQVLAATGGGLLIALHGLRPDLSPLSRFVSEYAVGPYGSVMRVTFFACGAALLCLGRAYHAGTLNRPWRIGVWLHYLAGAVMAAAGVFSMDPMTTPADQMTLEGQLHGFTGMIGMPAQPIGAALLAWGAWRAGHRAKVFLAPAAALSCASLIALDVSIISIMAAGPATFPLDTWVGLFNRGWFVGFFVWVFTAARSSLQSVHQSDDISSQSLHLEVMQLLPLMESLEECLALSQRDGHDDQSELVDERVVDQARDE